MLLHWLVLLSEVSRWSVGGPYYSKVRCCYYICGPQFGESGRSANGYNCSQHI